MRRAYEDRGANAPLTTPTKPPKRGFGRVFAPGCGQVATSGRYKSLVTWYAFFFWIFSFSFWLWRNLFWS